jgi:hypothetical protein
VTVIRFEWISPKGAPDHGSWFEDHARNREVLADHLKQGPSGLPGSKDWKIVEKGQEEA